MPYLPPVNWEESVLTKYQHDQLYTSLRIIREMYMRHFPQVPWSQVKAAPTVLREGEQMYMAGTTGQTIIHPIYGEAVAVNPETPNVLAQPHGTEEDSAAIDATKRILFKPAVNVHADIRRAPVKEQDGPMGSDISRDLIVYLATILLDEMEITVSQGDTFKYRGTTYEIKECAIPEEGYWLKHTTIPLYIKCHAAISRIGS